jgi:hypothetical protein
LVATGLIGPVLAGLAGLAADGHAHCGHSSLGLPTGHNGAEFLIFFVWLTIRRQYVELAVPYAYA